MVIKFADHGVFKGRPFWGYASYPGCDYLIDIDRRKKSHAGIFFNLAYMLLLSGITYYFTFNPIKYDSAAISKNIQLFGVGTEKQKEKAEKTLIDEAANSIRYYHTLLRRLKLQKNPHMIRQENGH